MKKNLKRIAAILSMLLIMAVPAQAFAATGCNIQQGFQNGLAMNKTMFDKLCANNDFSNCFNGLAERNNVKGVDAKNCFSAYDNVFTFNNGQYNGNQCTTTSNQGKNNNCAVAPGKDCTDNNCNQTTGQQCTTKDCNAAGKDCVGANCANGNNCNDSKCDSNTNNNGNNNNGNNNNNSNNNNNNSNNNNSTTVNASAQAQQVTSIVNKERAAAGLTSLQLDSALSKVAQAKAEDMAKNNYFSHTSPTYGSPFDMMQSFGISYKAAGENIAKGQRSAESVMSAWMNSSGHRANILNGNYEKIGVGYTTDAQGNTYWVQMFIK